MRGPRSFPAAATVVLRGRRRRLPWPRPHMHHDPAPPHPPFPCPAPPRRLTPAARPALRPGPHLLTGPTMRSDGEPQPRTQGSARPSSPRTHAAPRAARRVGDAAARHARTSQGGPRPAARMLASSPPCISARRRPLQRASLLRAGACRGRFTLRCAPAPHRCSWRPDLRRQGAGVSATKVRISLRESNSNENPPTLSCDVCRT